jgi:hypothetical protein
MEKAEALTRFNALVRQYGLRWGLTVPASAYAEMATISAVITPEEKRAALLIAGGPTPTQGCGHYCPGCSNCTE